MTEIHIRLGPMFSSKSVWLSGKASHFADLQKKVIYVNHLADEREVKSKDGILTSHRSNQRISKLVDQKKVSKLMGNNLETFDIICIDEGQFFLDLKQFLLEILKKEDKKIIYISALDGDFNQKMFSSIIDSLPLATTFKKKTAICKKCLEEGQHRVAAYTKLNNPDNIDNSDNNIIIGGDDLYTPVCNKHLYQQ